MTDLCTCWLVMKHALELIFSGIISMLNLQSSMNAFPLIFNSVSCFQSTMKNFPMTKWGPPLLWNQINLGLNVDFFTLWFSAMTEPPLLHPRNEDNRMFRKGGHKDHRINILHEKDWKQTQAHVGQSLSIIYFCCLLLFT